MADETFNERQPLVVNHRSSQFSDGGNGKCRQKVASGCILLTLTLERMAFYSLVGNLYLFLNSAPFNWFSYRALNASYIFTGVIYLVSPVWGWLADSITGKFKAIIAGLILYITGYTVLVTVSHSKNEIQTLCTWHWPNHTLVPISNSSIPMIQGQPCVWQLHTVLIAIAIAVGCLKANLSPFGADQIKRGGRNAARVYMNWYYWCVNIGALAALGGVVYVQQMLSNGFFYGYLIPAGCLVVALVIFVIGRPSYIVEKPGKSVLWNVVKIMWEGFRLFRLQKSRYSSRVGLDNTSLDPHLPPSWIDMAKVRFGGSFHESAVEEVKSLGKIMFVFTVLIPYWMVYFQMHTTFIAQGLHMRFDPKAEFNSSEPLCESSMECSQHRFMIPVAWLSLFDVIFLIVAIPLLDRVIYPALDRAGRTPTFFHRIAIGMVFAFAAVLMAGFLEMYRLYLVNQGKTIKQWVSDTAYPAADLWILWQIPQYSAIGVSEVFASVAGLELAYSYAPRAMKGLIMGMFCASMGSGSFLGVGLTSLLRMVPGWFSETDQGNINYAHMDYYLFVLAGVQLVALIIFFLLRKRVDFGTGRSYNRADSTLTESARFSFLSSDQTNYGSAGRGNNHLIYPHVGQPPPPE